MIQREMAKVWPDLSENEISSKRNIKNSSNSTSMINSPPRKYANNNLGTWYGGTKRPPPAPFIQQRHYPKTYPYQPRKPFVPPRKYPPSTHYTRNFKEEAERQNRLPPFAFNYNKYRTNNANIQGYRDPKYHSNINKSRKYVRSIEYSNNEIISPKSIENDLEFSKSIENDLEFENSFSSGTPSPTTFEPEPCEKNVINEGDGLKTSYFQVKLVNSYKEFSRIKAKGSIELPSKYETISFLKELLPEPKQPIVLFFDESDRVFYGAAVVCMDEFLEREELDTSTIESLSLKLNWIFLSDVEESALNFKLNISEPLDPQIGLEILKLMEEFETRLHDVQKIKPVKLKLKVSRLEELNDFFRLTEERINAIKMDDQFIDDSIRTNDHFIDDSIRTDDHFIDDSMLDLAANLAAYSMAYTNNNNIANMNNNIDDTLTMMTPSNIKEALMIPSVEDGNDDDFFDDYF